VNEPIFLIGDVRSRLADIDDQSVQCCVTSPPYWGLRDYGKADQIGLETTCSEYVAQIVAVFREVKRVLSDTGVLWLNLGDSYGKDKNILGVPWRVAFALQDDGWILRQDIVWAKPNPMPESVNDRCTRSHEYLFMLTKSRKYYFNDKAIAEEAKTKPGATWQERKAAGATAGNVIVGHETRNGTQRVVHGKGVTSNLTRQDGLRNKRSVWTINTKPFRGAHFAVMPEALVEPCVLASTKENDLVLDPFTGSGTVGVVAVKHGRNFVGIELNEDYVQIARQRISVALSQVNESNNG
jgi:site-specific DNA-methyltransferase (adenine-specific)